MPQWVIIILKGCNLMHLIFKLFLQQPIILFKKIFKVLYNYNFCERKVATYSMI